MSNMSYCRFQNTRQDLSDCVDAMEEIIYLDADSRLSEDEYYALKRMAALCEQFLANYSDFESENLHLSYEEYRAKFSARQATRNDDDDEDGDRWMTEGAIPAPVL